MAPACGTGTLLMATLQAVTAQAARAGAAAHDDPDLHRDIGTDLLGREPVHRPTGVQERVEAIRVVGRRQQLQGPGPGVAVRLRALGHRRGGSPPVVDGR